MMDDKAYAGALFLLTEERGSTERCADDTKTVAAALSENPDYLRLLDTPAVPKEEKLSLIDKAFPDADRDLISLLKILCEKREAHAFPAVAKTYLALVDDKMGILRVEAVTAVPMNENQLSRMAEKLGKETGKTVKIRNTVSPEILGGIKLRYLGKQLDHSVRTRLDAIEKSLKSVNL